VIDELEALEDHPEDERRLLQGELPPDAGSLAIAEGLVGVGGTLSLRLPAEVVGVEDVGLLAPYLPVAVEHGAQHHDLVVLPHPVHSADHLVLVRRQREHRRGGPEPERFLQDLLEIGELIHLGIGR
jgi:hypothetical protein